MADIYSRMNRIMDSMLTVYEHLKRNCFGALNDIEFEIAFKRVRSFFSLNANEAALFTFIFVNYFGGSEHPVNVGILAENAGANPLRFLEFRDEFKSLEEKGFIKTDSSGDSLSGSDFYRVTEEVTEAIIKNDVNLLGKLEHVKDLALTYPEDITEKQLFYKDSIKADVDSLASYLKKDSFNAIQDRLSEKSLPKGVCIMLHGEPGTGKTETVYQLARLSNRPIYHVDLGAASSQWHGGTITNLSAIFKKCNKICDRAKKLGTETPILLFNEADSIFGKRIESPSQGSEIDENHTQSFLLDYLEKQEGIVICTTNLAGNFDEAFERRFLFKIKFEKPDLDVKKKIWKNKITWLNKQSVEHLASNYALSGAEIDNVVRKATMKEVLTGKRSSFGELEGYCQKEKLENNHCGRIGFNG